MATTFAVGPELGLCLGVHVLRDQPKRRQTLEFTVAAERIDGKAAQRSSDRIALNVPARITWKDASGAVRFASVTTRNVGNGGAFVECESGAAIPLHRLVHLQVEKSVSAMQLPEQLRDGRVLSAVWRVGPCRRSTGTPSGYALRFLVEPRTQAMQAATRILQAVAV